MRRNLFSLAVAALAALLVSNVLWTTPAAGGNFAGTVLTIKGMTCGGCVAAVKLRLKKVKGVVAYEVSLEKGEAEVTYDPGQTDPDAIAAAVSEIGFKATVKPAEGKGGERDGRGAGRAGRQARRQEIKGE